MRFGGIKIFAMFFIGLLASFFLLLGINKSYCAFHENEESATQLWTCSMHPQIKLPHPGKCPICGMELIPVSSKGPSSDGASIRELTLSPTAQKLAEVQTSVARRMAVKVNVRLTGKIDFDERNIAFITTWIPGRLEKLFVDFTGTEVKRGAPMVEIYSPELFAAQSELLHAIQTLKHLQKSSLPTLRNTAYETVQSAREKLKLWGLTDDQIKRIIRRGKASYTMTIYSPISGTVVHKNGFEGMYVKTGTRIYTIADLSSLWLILDAYESDLTWVKVGDDVTFQVESFPGENFHGKISFIDPFVDKKTRTIRVRVDVLNKNGRLKPGMFAKATLHARINTVPPPLVIPASAPLITGKRAVVYVEVPGKPGTYEGKEIVLGPRAGDYYIVRYGLREGERVVTNGNFKIDSALQIKARPSMMTPEGGGGGGMQHHGGMKMSKKSPKMKSTAPASIPKAFKQDLLKVLKAYEDVSEAFQKQSQPEIEKAYSHLGRLLKQVNTEGLSGHPKMMWKELSMLIANDVVVALDAKKTLEKQDAFESLKNHIRRLVKQFNLKDNKTAKPASSQNSSHLSHGEK